MSIFESTPIWGPNLVHYLQISFPKGLICRDSPGSSVLTPLVYPYISQSNDLFLIGDCACNNLLYYIYRSKEKIQLLRHGNVSYICA